MLHIGIVFDSREEYKHLTLKSPDQYDEFEPHSTIEAMEQAIHAIGHKAVRIGGPFQLAKKKPDVDVIWNIGEGFGTRNREAWTPVLCELYGIPCLGSDALSLSISLDKVRTKQIAQQIGIPTATWSIAFFSDKSIPTISSFPVFVKPRYEGTAKGIQPSSLVTHGQELVDEVQRQWNLYDQDLLIESHLAGAEYTIPVCGNPMRCLDALERGIDSVTKIGIHALESKGYVIDDYELSNSLTESVEKQLQDWSLALCKELEILDFARLDFKCDSNGQPHFLEINPLPTFATDNTFAIIAEIRNQPYPEFLGAILKESLIRIGVGA